MKYWTGNKITTLQPSYIFVYGANTEGRNGRGAALAAREFGAKPYGGGRGIVGQTYDLVTKNLLAGFTEVLEGGKTITYPKSGKSSVSKEMIIENIKELYLCCNNNPELKFFVAYKNDNNNLNGYSSLDMFKMFVDAGAESVYNIYFHDSFKGC